MSKSCAANRRALVTQITSADYFRECDTNMGAKTWKMLPSVDQCAAHLQDTSSLRNVTTVFFFHTVYVSSSHSTWNNMVTQTSLQEKKAAPVFPGYNTIKCRCTWCNSFYGRTLVLCHHITNCFKIWVPFETRDGGNKVQFHNVEGKDWLQ